jgi:hypothetical protein
VFSPDHALHCFLFAAAPQSPGGSCPRGAEQHPKTEIIDDQLKNHRDRRDREDGSVLGKSAHREGMAALRGHSAMGKAGKGGEGALVQYRRSEVGEAKTWPLPRGFSANPETRIPNG